VTSPQLRHYRRLPSSLFTLLLRQASLSGRQTRFSSIRHARTHLRTCSDHCIQDIRKTISPTLLAPFDAASLDMYFADRRSSGTTTWRVSLHTAHSRDGCSENTAMGKASRCCHRVHIQIYQALAQAMFFQVCNRSLAKSFILLLSIYSILINAVCASRA